jgi:hypothetical protein
MNVKKEHFYTIYKENPTAKMRNACMRINISHSFISKSIRSGEFKRINEFELGFSTQIILMDVRSH